MSQEIKDGAVAHGGVLEEMTIDEVRAMRPEVVMLPIGSTEPHGPHLPHGTDVYEVTAVARPATIEANRRNARTLLYPTLPIGNNANMRKTPFALRIGVRTLMQVIIDIVLQCKDDGIKKVVILNGHGGNPPALKAAIREMSSMDAMPFVCIVNTWELKREGFVSPIVHPSDHAGENEGSRMLHLRPDLVHADKFADNKLGKVKVKALAQAEFARPWHLFMPMSAGGDSRLATAEKGKLELASEIDALAGLLVELSAAKWDERFPYE